MRNIILLASERSGTNLLRSLLGNHADISAPTAPHFFDFFKPILIHYGDLTLSNNMRVLLKHMIKLANYRFNDWSLEIDENELYDIYRPQNFSDAFNTMYSMKAKEDKKLFYFSKDINVYNYIDQLNYLICKPYEYLQTDGVGFKKVNWLGYAWQTCKGWLGFANYCDKKNSY